MGDNLTGETTNTGQIQALPGEELLLKGGSPIGFQITTRGKTLSEENQTLYWGYNDLSEQIKDHKNFNNHQILPGD